MKRGFTLIELLGVIVILGIIGMLTVPLVSNLIKESKEEVTDLQAKAVKDAARNYANANIYSLTDCSPEPCTVKELTIKELKEEGYLDTADIKGANGQTYGDDAKVLIQKNNGKYKYVFPVE